MDDSLTLTEYGLLKQRALEEIFAGMIFTSPAHAVAEASFLEPAQIASNPVRALWTEVLAVAKTKEVAIEDVYRIGLEQGILDDLLNWSSGPYNSFMVREFAIEIQRRAFINGTLDPFLQKVVEARQKNDVDAVFEACEQLTAKRPASDNALIDTKDISALFACEAADPSTIVLSTGIGAVDRAIGGCVVGQMMLIGAPPSRGKSSFVNQLAMQVARDGHQVLFFSTQMQSSELWAKTVCGRVGVNYRDMIARRLTPEIVNQLIDVSGQIANEVYGRLWIDDTPAIDIATVTRRIQEIKPRLVIFDMVRDIQIPGLRTDNLPEAIGEKFQRTRDLARRFKFAAIGTVHLGRHVQARSDKRPQMEDISDTSQAEKVADAILFLHTPPSADTSPTRKVIDVDLWVEKYRMVGREIQIKLRYNLVHQLFAGREE